MTTEKTIPIETDTERLDFIEGIEATVVYRPVWVVNIDLANFYGISLRDAIDKAKAYLDQKEK